jgi:hypothetical protein
MPPASEIIFGREKTRARWSPFRLFDWIDSFTSESRKRIAQTTVAAIIIAVLNAAWQHMGVLAEAWQNKDALKRFGNWIYSILTSPIQISVLYLLYLLLLVICIIWFFYWIHSKNKKIVELELKVKELSPKSIDEILGAVKPLKTAENEEGKVEIINVISDVSAHNLSNQELALGGMQYSLQQKQIQLQNFENLLTQKIDQQIKIVDSMQTNDGSIVGRRCFEIWYCQQFAYIFHNEWRKTAGLSMQRIIPNEKEYVVKCYELFYKQYQDKLAHYLNNLFNIFNYVNESDLLVDTTAAKAEQRRRKQILLVRDQVSTYELCILFYHGISKHGTQFKTLIENYGLMQNLDDNKGYLLNPIHEAYYAKSAFGGSLGACSS